MTESIDLAALGAPEHLRSWRPGQEDLALRTLNAARRAVVHCAPVGTGKTLGGMATALSVRGPAVVLTESKGLQDQYLSEWAGAGLADLRGRSNYNCFSRPDWTCADGAAAGCKYRADKQCPHQVAHAKAKEAKVCVMNYSTWCYNQRYSYDRIGNRSLLILDEAHAAESFVADAMSVLITERQAADFVQAPPPSSDLDMQSWKDWSLTHLNTVTLEVEHRKARLLQAPRSSIPKSTIEDFQVIQNLLRNMETLASADPEGWFVRRVEEGWRFDVLDVADYVENILLVGTPRVMLMSGTITPYRAKRLLGDMLYDYFGYDLPFPMAHFRVVSVPAVRMRHGMPQEDIDKLVSYIDQIIEGRYDRKGLIIPVSFRLQDEIYNRSRNRRIMIRNSRGEPISRVVEQFRLASAPRVMISPSIGTGFDFAHDQARYCVIPKVPYPDTSDPLTRVRSERDPLYIPDIAAQKTVQYSGRVVRGETDWGEVIILDSMFSYHGKRHKDLYPPYFFRYVRNSKSVPPAMAVPKQLMPVVHDEDDDIPF